MARISQIGWAECLHYILTCTNTIDDYRNCDLFMRLNASLTRMDELILKQRFWIKTTLSGLLYCNDKRSKVLLQIAKKKSLLQISHLGVSSFVWILHKSSKFTQKITFDTEHIGCNNNSNIRRVVMPNKISLPQLGGCDKPPKSKFQIWTTGIVSSDQKWDKSSKEPISDLPNNPPAGPF